MVTRSVRRNQWTNVADGRTAQKHYAFSDVHSSDDEGRRHEIYDNHNDLNEITEPLEERGE